MNPGLRFALLGKVVLPLLGVFALVIYTSLAELERTAERRLQEDIELVARAIRLPISDSLERSRPETVEQSLRSVFEIGRVYGAYVFDEHGERIAAVGMVEPERRDERKAAAVAAIGERQGEYRQIEGREVYSYFVPLVDTGGRINGLLQVVRQQSDFTRVFDALRQRAWLIMLGGTLVVGLIVLLGHDRAIGRHVRALLASMQRVESGERGHRAVARGPREIRRLADGLNAMLDAIARNETELDEQRRARDALSERLRESEKLASLGRMASGVAHELGAPLSVIDGRARRVQKTPTDDPAPALAQIREQVRRMTGFIRQLLDFARASADRPRRLAVTDLADSAIRAIRAEFADADQRLRRPTDSEPLWLEGDPVRLEQALTNLLRNALQASPEGAVVLDWQVRGRWLELGVDDAGPGIDTGVRSRLFEPFVTTKPVGRGTGLGLSIVHAVALEHGGRVTVDDSPGGGARFTLTLPLAEDGDDER